MGKAGFSFVKSLQFEKNCGKMTIVNGWAACPVCGNRKLMRVLPSTRVVDAVCYCKKCKCESLVTITNESQSYKPAPND